MQSKTADELKRAFGEWIKNREQLLLDSCSPERHLRAFIIDKQALKQASFKEIYNLLYPIYMAAWKQAHDEWLRWTDSGPAF